MNVVFSIIVPVYNVKQYLSQCVDSILQQSYTNFELLLIDDGSSDDSGKICDEYALKDNRIRVFHKQNGGVSSARNIGLDNAQGKWVVFVDSDDWVDEKMLETLFEYEQEYQTDLLFYGFQKEMLTGCFDNLNLFRKISGRYEGTDLVISACHLLETNDLLGWTCNKLFKNSIIQDLGIRFNKEFSVQEDLIFTLEYIKYVTNLAIYAYAPYHYRMVQDSLVNRMYPYSLHKKRINLLFQQRISLVDHIENAENAEKYRRFVTGVYLWNLLAFYGKSLGGYEKDDISFIRAMIKKYALTIRNLKFFILYVFSFFPNCLFYLLLEFCVKVKKVC